MKVEQVDVDGLQFDSRNAKMHDERSIVAVMKSLEEFGQQKPIVVDEDNVVRAGNGLLEAAIKLGWPQINIVRTHLKGNDLLAYGIADNRTSELSDWDYKVLGEHLTELAAQDWDLEVTGFADYESSMIMQAEWTPYYPEEEDGTEGDGGGETEESSRDGDDLEFKLNAAQIEIYNQALKMVIEKEGVELEDSAVILYLCEDYLKRAIKASINKE